MGGCRSLQRVDGMCVPRHGLDQLLVKSSYVRVPRIEDMALPQSNSLGHTFLHTSYVFFFRSTGCAPNTLMHRSPSIKILCTSGVFVLGFVVQHTARRQRGRRSSGRKWAKGSGGDVKSRWHSDSNGVCEADQPPLMFKWAFSLCQVPGIVRIFACHPFTNVRRVKIHSLRPRSLYPGVTSNAKLASPCPAPSSSQASLVQSTRLVLKCVQAANLDRMITANRESIGILIWSFLCQLNAHLHFGHERLNAQRFCIHSAP